MTLHAEDPVSVRTETLENKFAQRSGVVPYVVFGNTIYFLFGIDKNTKELTDFGGGVKKGEDVLTGALREFREETSRVFMTMYNVEKLKKGISLINQDMCIIFVRLNGEQFKYGIEQFKTKKNAEIDKFYCMREDLLVKLLNSKNKEMIKMWDKIYKFLKTKNFDAFYQLLKQL